MPLKNRAVAGVWAFILVAVVLVGVPAALWWAGGNPVSAASWREVIDGWGSGLAPEITTGAVVQVLSGVCWLAWLLLAAAVVGELVAAVQGGSARRIRGLTFFQGIASVLVAPLALSLSALPAAARAPAPLREVRVASTAPSLVMPPPATVSRADPPPGHYRVRLGDTLDRVAEEQLGAAMRWRELWALNGEQVMNDGRTFTKPTGLREGWDLRLPGDARGQRRVEPTAPTGVIAKATYSPATTTWTVERGQSVRRIANLAYGVTDSRAAIAVVNAIVEANRLADTSALEVGASLRLPVVAGGPQTPAAAPTAAPEPVVLPEPMVVVVERGDTLARIAERTYGDATRWPAIWDANQGRDVGGGAVLVDPDQIDVGWQLLVPDAPVVAPASHVVVPGDTLWDISADHYQREDAALVDLVFDTNRGVSDSNGHTLGDPDLIHPGMLLDLPADPTARAQAPAPAPVVEPVTEPPPIPVEPVLESAPPPPPPASLTPVEAPPPPASLTPVEAAPPAPPPVSLTPVDASPAIEVPPPAQLEAAPAPTPPSGAVERRAVQVEVQRRGLGAGELTLATLLATGALTVVDARRRRRLQRMGAHDVLPLPDPDLAPTDAALRAGADAPGMARLDVALRALAAQLAGTAGTAGTAGWPSARPELVVRHASGRIEVHLDTVAGDPCSPWVAEGARVWALAPTVATTGLVESAQGVAPPCPALVMLGRAGTSEVYLDLEAAGIVRLDGAPRDVLALARGLVAGLAVSPLADVVRVVATGIDVYGFANEARVETVEGVPAALHAAQMAVAPVQAMLDDGGPATTFELRARGAHEPWEPTLVLLLRTPLDGEQAADVAALVGEGGRGVAVVTDHPVSTSRWRLSVAEGRRWRLDPIGLTLEPVRLAADELADLGALLQDARTDPVAAPVVVSIPAAAPLTETTVAPFEEPAWTLMVRVLGPVEVVNRDGKVGQPEKSKALELLVWLTHHRTSATRTAARTAMWETDVRDATFANVVSDARRTLARLAEPPEGEDWIARSNGERLPLHPLVTTDADLVRARLDRARTQPDVAAIETLRDALEMVRDAPYAGTSYLWPDGEGWPSNLTLLVTATASEMAVRALRLGDVEAVFWATSQGLRVLPGHDELVCLRMQAHAAAGDLASVRLEYEAYERVILSDAWGDATPSAKVVEWRTRLLRGEPIE